MRAHIFYSENSKVSCQYFIKCLCLEIDTQLSDFKLSCTSNNKHNLLELFKEVHKESNSHLDVMVD